MHSCLVISISSMWQGYTHQCYQCGIHALFLNCCRGSSHRNLVLTKQKIAALSASQKKKIERYFAPALTPVATFELSTQKTPNRTSTSQYSAHKEWWIVMRTTCHTCHCCYAPPNRARPSRGHELHSTRDATVSQMTLGYHTSRFSTIIRF